MASISYMTPSRFAAIRVREIERVIQHKHGTTLPDDEHGRDILFVVANHMASGSRNPTVAIARWAGRWAYWYPEFDLEGVIEVATQSRLKFKADKLALLLGLTDAERSELAIKTIGSIDVHKAARTCRSKQQARNRRARSAPHIARAQ
jgi:hypothetical protein